MTISDFRKFITLGRKIVERAYKCIPGESLESFEIGTDNEIFMLNSIKA